MLRGAALCGVGVNSPPRAGPCLPPPLHGPGRQLGWQPSPLSERRIVGERTPRLLWTLPIGTFILLLNGCVCTPVKLRGDGSQHARAKGAWRKAEQLSAHRLPVCNCGSPASDAQPPSARSAHSRASPSCSFPRPVTVEGRSLTSEQGMPCPGLTALNVGLGLPARRCAALTPPSRAVVPPLSRVQVVFSEALLRSPCLCLTRSLGSVLRLPSVSPQVLSHLHSLGPAPGRGGPPRGGGCCPPIPPSCKLAACFNDSAE